MNNKINQQTVLITGSTGAIGKSITLNMLKNGTKVIALGKNKKELDIIRNKFKELFYYYIVDLSDDIDNIEMILKELITEHGKFSGFVHCAGKLLHQPIQIWNMDDAIVDFKINVFSAIKIIKFLAKQQNKQELLNIVLISSISSNIGNPGAITYSMTKASLDNLVVSLSKELSKKRIRINSILPGCVPSNMSKYYSSILNYDYFQSSKEKTFFKELCSAENISDVAIFLLSKESYWIQGQNIIVDGGESLC